MKKTALALMCLTILSKVVGFLREITLAYFYGATPVSDAYLISLTIPNVIFALIGAGLAMTYIPLYSSIVQEKGVWRADRFTHNLLNYNFLFCAAIFGVGIVFTVPLVKIFAVGFSGETLRLAVLFTRVTFIGIFFYAVINILSAYLQINNNFLVPAAIGFPLSLITIIAIMLSAQYNLLILAWGSVLAVLAQVFLLVPFVRQKGYRYQVLLDKKDEYLKKLVILSVPIILSTAVNQINVVVDRTLASQIVAGGISALNYAVRLNGFVQGVFVASIATVIYPLIARKAAEKEMNSFKKVLAKAMGGINLFMVPATVGMMIFAQPIVRLLFGRGVFDEQAINLTAFALFFYALGMVGLGLRAVLDRAFYSLQDTKTPMINATIAIILNIILNLILSRYLGIGGLALATSISLLFCTFLLGYSLWRKIGPFGLQAMLVSLAKITLASGLMGFAAYSFYEFLQHWVSAGGALVLAISGGAGFYFLLIYFFRVKEMKEIILLAQQEIKRWQG